MFAVIETLLSQIDHRNEGDTSFSVDSTADFSVLALLLKTNGKEAFDRIVDVKDCNFLWHEILWQMDIKIYVR